jgi:glyoxylase-like metal-dependent hydrolase (beta-lactamase superfamily II)
MTDPHDDIVRIGIPTPFQVGAVNVFLIKQDPPILVDAGLKSEHSYDLLTCKLRDHGVTVRDIGTVLVTHGHVDHVGLLAQIVEESGAETYAHPYAVRRFEEDDEAAEEASRPLVAALLAEYGLSEDVVKSLLDNRDTYKAFASKVVHAHSVSDGEAVGDFTAYHVPGHSPSDTLFVDQNRKMAFTGDHLLKMLNPNPLIRYPRPNEQRAKSLIEYRDSLRRTRELDVDVCYPGHGKAFGDHRGVIDRILNRQDRRTEQVLGFLEERALTPFEVCRRIYPDLKTGYLFLGLSVAVGHLELLEQECRAVAKHQDGVLYYTPLVS